MLQQMIDASQVSVNGVVRLKLYKGQRRGGGRKSDDSLNDANIATFEGRRGSAYNDRAGFIKLNALRMRIATRTRAALQPTRAACDGTKNPAMSRGSSIGCQR